MTPVEARAIADRANSVTYAHEQLVAKREKLAFAKKWVTDKNTWKPELRLAEDRWSGRDITITVIIPSAWIIQQVLDEVKAAERAYILAGGTL